VDPGETVAMNTGFTQHKEVKYIVRFSKYLFISVLDGNNSAIYKSEDGGANWRIFIKGESLAYYKDNEALIFAVGTKENH
jgi:hypothetical protein